MHGDWINFATLCERVPGKSASTLRRYTAERLISSRQMKRGGRIEFNWRTVERELAAMESHGVHAHLVTGVDLQPGRLQPGPIDIASELAAQRSLLERIAAKVGVA